MTTRDRQLVLVATIALWAAALVYAIASARLLYADGAYNVLDLLLNPGSPTIVDPQRATALWMYRTPFYLGQRLGFDSVAALGALYTTGVIAIPAAALMLALFLARHQVVLFATIALAIVVYGFGTNYINTEANLMFGFVWLAVTLLALDRPAPLLRGFLLPVIAYALIRSYEGMLLVGPVLAVWVAAAALRTQEPLERIGFVLSSLFFLKAAAVGFGGFLAPHNPENSAHFAAAMLAYLRNPQAFLLLSALGAFVGAVTTIARVRVAGAVASAVFGLVFLGMMVRLEGYYAYSIYYLNRSFLTLSLPTLVGALLATWYFRPEWLTLTAHRRTGALLLIPLIFAVSGDMLGTYRWNQYVRAFCEVLARDVSPDERLYLLKQSGARTAWVWTHPTMSVLLGGQGSAAMVVNEPGTFTWQPFDPSDPPSISSRGLCQTRLRGS